MLKSLCTLGALLVLCVNAEARTPRPYLAEYEAHAYGQNVGTATRRLEKTADGWRLSISSEAQLLFLSSKRHEVSELRHSADGWQSLSYQIQDQGPRKTKTGSQRYDWGAKVIKGERDGAPWQLPLLQQTFDPASYQLQLSDDLAAGKTALNYPLVSRGKLKTYHFKRLGEERLDTPAGKLATVKLEKPAAPEDDESTVIWFAPTLDHLPVRIEHRKNGKPEATLLLRRYTPTP